MAAPPVIARMTADEFYKRTDLPEKAELLDGEVVLAAGAGLTPSASAKHNRIGQAIFVTLYAHVAPRHLGDVYSDGMGYELPPEFDTVLVPDVSFVRAERVPDPETEPRVWRLAPDLAVEVLSESDRPTVLRRKRERYFGAGTALLWHVDPDARGVEVWTPGAAPRWMPEDGVLDGGTVLPEFAVPVRDLFARVPRGAA